MSDHSLQLPDDFNDYAWEIEAKGWFSGARLVVGGKAHPMNFYDPVRLAQEIASEHARGGAFCEPNLVVVKTVTRPAMEDAVKTLVKSGRVGSLVAE